MVEHYNYRRIVFGTDFLNCCIVSMILMYIVGDFSISTGSLILNAKLAVENIYCIIETIKHISNINKLTSTKVKAVKLS